MGCYEMACETEKLHKRIAQLEEIRDYQYTQLNDYQDERDHWESQCRGVVAQREIMRRNLLAIKAAWVAWQKVRELGGGPSGPRWAGCAPHDVIEALDKAVEDMWKA